MSARMELNGQRFGLLTVTAFSHIGGKSSYWVCQCDCGRVHTSQGSHLKTGNIKSCGCIPRGVKPFVDDPINRTRANKVFHAMWTRCTDPRHPSHHRYRAKGITVCDRWKSFEAFVEDMGYPPVGLTLDRIDNAGHYTPDNCRWATRKEQMRNRDVTVYIEVEGRRMTFAEWAEGVGAPYPQAFKQWRRGWSKQRIIEKYGTA